MLRPDWLANGIYAILRANDPRHEKPLAPDGIVEPKSLGPIYSAAEKLEMLKATAASVAPLAGAAERIAGGVKQGLGA